MVQLTEWSWSGGSLGISPCPLMLHRGRHQPVLYYTSAARLSHVDMLMSFNGTHCSPHNVATSLATKTPLEAERGDVGSVMAGLPGETAPFLGSFPQMSYSGSRQMMLSYIWLYQPRLELTSAPQGFRPDSIDRKCSICGSLCEQRARHSHLVWLT